MSFSNSLLLSFRSRTWDLNSSKQEIKCLKPQIKVQFMNWTVEKTNIQVKTLRWHIVFSRENKVEEKWRLANLFAVHAHGLKLKTMNWYQLLQFQYQQGSNPIPPSVSEPQWTPQVYPKGSDSQDWKKWTLRRLRIQAAEEEYLKVISECQFDDLLFFADGHDLRIWSAKSQ